MGRNIDNKRTISDASETEDHKNEGFLKSIWHNLTNHPAHQKDNTDDSSTKGDKKKGEKNE